MSIKSTGKLALRLEKRESSKPKAELKVKIIPGKNEWIVEQDGKTEHIRR